MSKTTALSIKEIEKSSGLKPTSIGGYTSKPQNAAEFMDAMKARRAKAAYASESKAQEYMTLKNQLGSSDEYEREYLTS